MDGHTYTYITNSSGSLGLGGPGANPDLPPPFPIHGLPPVSFPVAPLPISWNIGVVDPHASKPESQTNDQPKTQ